MNATGNHALGAEAMTINAELNWVNVNYDSLQGKAKVAYDNLNKARAAFRDSLVQQAREAKAIGPNDTLKLSFKAWGFGMAKVEAKAASKTSNGKDMFAAL